MIAKENFEKLFHTYFVPLCSVANAIVKDEDTAKDIVQFVFVNLWNKRNEIIIISSEKSYLHRAVINTSLNYIKKHKAQQFSNNLQTIDKEYQSDCTNEQLALNETKQKIFHAINELPVRCRTAFSLSRFTSMTNEEIAGHLSISIKAVEKHITKALKQLREKLNPLIKNNLILFFWFMLWWVFLSNLKVGYFF